MIAWKDSLENDAAVSQTLFSKPFLIVIPSWEFYMAPPLKKCKIPDEKDSEEGLF